MSDDKKGPSTFQTTVTTIVKLSDLEEGYTKAVLEEHGQQMTAKAIAAALGLHDVTLRRKRQQWRRAKK